MPGKNSITLVNGLLTLTMLTLFPACNPQRPAVVPEKVMEQVYEEIKTPYKYG